MELLTEHLGHGLGLTLLLSLPAVLLAAGIGLVVGILQAVTQVQEQTIAAAPKILGVFLLILLGGGTMLTMLENYVTESFQIAFNEIPQDGVFVLPPKASQTSGQGRARAFFNTQVTSGANSAKMKEISDSWRVPDDGSAAKGTSIMKGGSSKPGSALGPAEKMSLDKNR